MEASRPNSTHSSSDDDVVSPNNDTQQEQELVTTRAYQLEMFEKSMQSNIIVTMETGSGKTWCAKLRIEAELTRNPVKIVWFTAPSVVLAEQQHKYLSRHLTSYSTRLITGSDNTHLWSTQKVWDTILNVNLIVSTPQVLLEGLERGFVHLQRLSLLVIDECHHCIAKDPSNVMMQLFYHPARRTNSTTELPCILGMTASPITSRLADMDTLEKNLDAVCKSPTQQIEEYQKYVHMPEIVTLNYVSREERKSLSIELMLRVVESVDISEDPWVKQLLKENTPCALHKRDKVLETRKTFCMDQLKKLQGNTQHLYDQLGAWATNIWLREVLLKLHSKVETMNWLTSISDEEYRYMDQKVLGEIRELTCKAVEEGKIMHQMSSKSDCLVQFLINEYATDPNASCVIFVERRSTAFALTKLLQGHPSVQCTVASFVGSSNSAKKTNLIDLADLASQKTELDEFRSGERSIVVATSVMEEGIDIQAVNLIVRFDDALNMRAYIQSRGRARKVASKFVVLINITEPTPKKYTEWMMLEDNMRRAYTDELRQIQNRLRLEAEDHEEGTVYTVSSTEAKLTFLNARGLLEHFSQSLRKVQFEPNPRPTYICQTIDDCSIRAKVILPSSLPADLKEVFGMGVWLTQKTAKRDAAFEAVKRLHTSGLINDHLLPPSLSKTETHIMETRASFADIKPQANPWLPISSDVDTNMLLHAYRLDFEDVPEPLPSLILLLPTAIGSDISVLLRYTKFQTFQARVSHIEARTTSVVSRALAQEVTLYLLQTALVSQTRNPECWEKGFPFYLLPDIPENDLFDWFELNRRNSPLVELLSGPSPSSKGRVALALKDPYGQRIYISDLDKSDLTRKESLEIVPAVMARRKPRRIDYVTEGNIPSSMAGQQSAIPIEECTVLQLSALIIDAVQFVPSVVHMIGFALVATMCRKELLQSLQIVNERLLVEALTTPHACGHTNYERLEFFGDTLLKLYACLQVFAEPQNALLPESYLTFEAAKLENNARLQRGAIAIGLDRFLINDSFKPKEWKPETSISQRVNPKKKISTKVIADHVEALIAVAFLDNKCSNDKDVNVVALLNTFLPEIQWKSPSVNTAAVIDRQPSKTPSFEVLSVAESILGYRFRKRHLLSEALNHSSVSSTVPTYGRLEFLGDAVLQRIVNEAVYHAPARYSQNAMHLRQIACVSHSYLAFLCFEAWHEVERVNNRTDLANQKAVLEKTTQKKYLWEFMTHSNAEIAAAQQRSLKRYLEYGDGIRKELEQSKTYPWALLASLAAPKFFSDIIESVLGAVFIDCGANLDSCTQVLGKLGLMTLVQRLIDEPDMVLAQPKTILWQERSQAGLPALKVVSWSHREAHGQRYGCQLLLEGDIYAEMDDAWCDEEAVLKTCEIGLRRFREEQEASKMPEVGLEDGQLSIEDEQRKRKREDSLHSAVSSIFSDEE